MWAESGPAVLGIERRIAMNKHDELIASGAALNKLEQLIRFRLLKR